MSLDENYISVIYKGAKISIHKPWAEHYGIKEGDTLKFNEYQIYNIYACNIFNL